MSAVRRWNSSENFRRKERTLVRRKLHLIALPPCHQARHLVWWKWFPWLKYYQRWSIESNVAPVEDSFPAIISLEFLCYHDTTILKVTKSFAKIIIHSVWKITTKSLILWHCERSEIWLFVPHFRTLLNFLAPSTSQNIIFDNKKQLLPQINIIIKTIFSVEIQIRQYFLFFSNTMKFWYLVNWSILNQTLCFFFPLIGCMIIGYMAWVLSTSVTVSRFLDGTLVRSIWPYDNWMMMKHFCICFAFQIFTYVVIGLGFTLFFSGLIGWVGGASESPCLVRLFLFSVVVSMIAEIGGIISLNIVRLEVHTTYSNWLSLNSLSLSEI